MERTLSVVGILLVAGAAAAAEPVSDRVLAAHIAELNESALHKIEAKRFDGAKKHLRDAERMANARGGRYGDALLAQTYVHMGALELIAGGNRLHATVLFRRAICRNLDIRPRGPIVATTDVRNLFDAVASSYREPGECEYVRGIRERDPGAEEPELPARIAALDCPTPDEALAGRDFVVRCVAAAPLGVESVTLRYRPGTTIDKYVTVEMRRSAKGWWTAAVPARVVTGRSFAYYTEGLNARGHAVVANGAADSPNLGLVISDEGCACD